MKYIGLLGKKRHGKSTAAKYLEETHHFQRLNFKDALVEELKENFPELLDEIANQYDATIPELFEDKPPLMRKLMQNYGTNVRRKDDDDYWVEMWQDTTWSLLGFDIVADDVRFKNEAAAIKERGGILVKIIRPDYPSDDTHQSEQEMDTIEVDYIIEAHTGEQDKIYKELDNIVSTL